MMENQHRKISTYRELTQEEIDLMNRCKAAEAQVLELIQEVQNQPHTDTRWSCQGKLDIEKGFMALVRSIARPEPYQPKE